MKHSPVVSHLQQVYGPFLQRTGLNKAWLSAEGSKLSFMGHFWWCLVMVDFYLETWPRHFFTLETCRAKMCVYVYIYMSVCMYFSMLHLLLGKYQTYFEDVHSFFLSITLSNLQLEKTYTLFWGFQGHPHFDKVPIWYQSQSFGRRPKSTTLIQLHFLRVPGLSWHIARTTSHTANGADTSCYRRRGQNPWKLRRAERKNFAKSSHGVSLGDFCQPEPVKTIKKTKALKLLSLICSFLLWFLLFLLLLSIIGF